MHISTWFILEGLFVTFLYSLGAYVIIILVKGLIMVNCIIKGLICNFWNYKSVKCKSDMFGLCDFYMSVIMCLVSFVTPNLFKLTLLTLKHVRWPNETLILENNYKRKSVINEAVKLDIGKSVIYENLLILKIC